ncbi:MAG: hypothetical protein G01um101413_375 [Parcubacteria group bacterium Gr01-1014_13]|nr:MAG: hypothetical protein G01um101413_375 [Parcubacteria group bacterium Gr01-1014_13]
MKNYSSNRAQKGKTGYRTPSTFKANKSMYSPNKLKGAMGKNHKSQTHNFKANQF